MVIVYQSLCSICILTTYPNSKPTAKITTTLTNPIYIQVKFLDKIFLHWPKGTSSCATQHHKMKNHINPNDKDETIGLSSSLRLHLSLRRGMLHLTQTLWSFEKIYPSWINIFYCKIFSNIIDKIECQYFWNYICLLTSTSPYPLPFLAEPLFCMSIFFSVEVSCLTSFFCWPLSISPGVS